MKDCIMGVDRYVCMKFDELNWNNDEEIEKIQNK